MLDHDDKAQSSKDAEPLRVNERHRALMRRLISGMTLTDACTDIGFTVSRASIVVNSPMFQEEMSRMREQLNDKFTDVEAERSGDTTRTLLSESSEKAATALRYALEDENPIVRVSAAKDILDRTGYAKEDKIKAKIFVEPSQSLIDVLARMQAEVKPQTKEDTDGEPID